MPTAVAAAAGLSNVLRSPSRSAFSTTDSRRETFTSNGTPSTTTTPGRRVSGAGDGVAAGCGGRGRGAGLDRQVLAALQVAHAAIDGFGRAEQFAQQGYEAGTGRQVAPAQVEGHGEGEEAALADLLLEQDGVVVADAQQGVGGLAGADAHVAVDREEEQVRAVVALEEAAEGAFGVDPLQGEGRVDAAVDAVGADELGGQQALLLERAELLAGRLAGCADDQAALLEVAAHDREVAVAEVPGRTQQQDAAHVGQVEREEVFRLDAVQDEARAAVAGSGLEGLLDEEGVHLAVGFGGLGHDGQEADGRGLAEPDVVATCAWSWSAGGCARTTR